MKIYLKFGDERKTVEEIEDIMYSGNIEAAKCLGNYYAKKRKSDYDNYFRCIFFYLFGAKNGCPECMIKVSKYAYEYARLLDNETDNQKCYYVLLSAQYALEAIKYADSKNLRTRAMNCVLYSTFLLEENNNLIKQYIK